MSSTAITAVSILLFVEGVLRLVAYLPIAIFVMQNRELPVLFGIRALGGGFIEDLGLGIFIAWTLLFVALSPLHFLAGYWLWQSLRIGGLLGIVLLIPDIVSGIGYESPDVVLPIIRAILLAVGWNTLH